jgi:hypothetical protein
MQSPKDFFSLTSKQFEQNMTKTSVVSCEKIHRTYAKLKSERETCCEQDKISKFAGFFVIF